MGRKRTFDEEEVLGVVRDLFWLSGYEGISTYDLMEHTGLGKGSIYLAFGSKHSLFMRTLTDYCTDLIDRTRAAMKDSPFPAHQRIEQYLLSIARDFASQTPRRGCFLAKATTELAQCDEEVAQHARRTFDELAATFADALRETRGTPTPANDTVARDEGYHLVSVLLGLDCLARAGATRTVLEAAVRRATAGHRSP
ncbi:TetR/AcrR family transcriptional regulator [Streptomyces mirabilis]|uniref:TetR/AcrR family transcriptional regulator n=1 Tax=Streptomyces mirabilis TaxID=68239 RepID=UPI0036C83ABC